MPVLTATEFRAIPAGVYNARISRLEDGPSDYGPSFRFIFTVTDDPDYAGEEIHAIASATFGPKSKLRQWAQTLFNRQFQAGENFDTDSMLNIPCQITLTVEQGDQGERNKVVALSPRQRPQRRPAPQPQPEPEPQEEESDQNPFTAPRETRPAPAQTKGRTTQLGEIPF